MSQVIAAILLLFAPATAPAGDRLIVCGGEEVFIIAAEGAERPPAPKKIWSWRAADSPEIPAEVRPQFRTTDECKPIGDNILITSSSGGVALVRRADKKCLFVASVKNAHSACLLPGRRVAVAGSSGSDALVVFDLDKSGAAVAPVASLPLKGGHGAHWDEQRKRLWVLGTHELLLVNPDGGDKSVEPVVDQRWTLPTPGGHDLSPCQDPRYLFVTSNSHVYRFDTETRQFTPLKELADHPSVKSIDQHPKTGRIVWHQGTEKTWWSDTIRFLEPVATIRLENERMYKVRWDVPK